MHKSKSIVRVLNHITFVVTILYEKMENVTYMKCLQRKNGMRSIAMASSSASTLDNLFAEVHLTSNIKDVRNFEYKFTLKMKSTFKIETLKTILAQLIPFLTMDKTVDNSWLGFIALLYEYFGFIELFIRSLIIEYGHSI